MLSFLDEDETVEVLRVIEKDAYFLSPRGELLSPDANHSVVRYAMRQFVKVYSTDKDDKLKTPENDNELKEMLMGIEGKDSEYIIMVDMDKALTLLLEVVLTRISFVEESLAKIYTEGDDNGDGVLSFQEFLNIVTKVAPHYPQRRVLKMFREALQIGDGIYLMSHFLLLYLLLNAFLSHFKIIFPSFSLFILFFPFQVIA